MKKRALLSRMSRNVSDNFQEPEKVVVRIGHFYEVGALIQVQFQQFQQPMEEQRHRQRRPNTSRQAAHGTRSDRAHLLHGVNIRRSRPKIDEK